MKFYILRKKKKRTAAIIAANGQTNGNGEMENVVSQAEAQDIATKLSSGENYELTEQDVVTIKRMVVFYEKAIDYMDMRNKPFRMMWTNLIGGMAKGFGIAIGITLLAFLAFKILTGLQILDLPIIGDFIAELLEYISSVQNMKIV